MRTPPSGLCSSSVGYKTKKQNKVAGVKFLTSFNRNVTFSAIFTIDIITFDFRFELILN